MLKGMQHHYTKGFLYSVIKFEWSSYTQLSAHYSATTGSLFRTCGSIHSQYSLERVVGLSAYNNDKIWHMKLRVGRRCQVKNGL